jgi:hypothetical protein
MESLLRTHRINGPVMLSEAKHLWLALETGCRK